MRRFFCAIFMIGISIPFFAFARVGFVTNQGVWVSNQNAFAGDTIKIYTVVVNNTTPKLAPDV